MANSQVGSAQLPMKCYLQIVGDPASPSILVFLDSKSILINAGEGTQRLFTESRVRLRKIQAVCFTQVTEETIGGLPGLLLTLADMEEAAIGLSIHGPAELGALLRATRHFMHHEKTEHVKIDLRSLNLESAPRAESAADGVLVFDDPELRMWAIVLRQTARPFRVEANNGGGDEWNISRDEAGGGSSSSTGADASSAAAACCDDERDLAENDDAESCQSSDEAKSAKRAWADSSGADNDGAKRARVDIEQRSAADTLPSCSADAAVKSAERPICCYIGRALVPAKFDARRAAALGIPRGPLLGRLAKGETIQLPDGRTVTPADVIETLPQPHFCIIDCPSAACVEQLLAHPAFAASRLDSGSYGSGDSGGSVGPEAATPMACVVHLTPAHVWKLPRYQEFVKRFGSSTQHIVANRHACCAAPPSVFRSAEVNHLKLNRVHSDVFPRYVDSHSVPSSTSAASACATAIESVPLGLRTVPAENMLRFSLAPLREWGLDRSEVPSRVDEATEIDAVLDALPEFTESVTSLQRQLGQFTPSSEDSVLSSSSSFSMVACAAGSPAAGDQASCRTLHRFTPSLDPARPDPEIVFLGTGSAVPSKYRNVSSTFVQLDAEVCMLLDCGEGTLAQLQLRFGAAPGSRCFSAHDQERIQDATSVGDDEAGVDRFHVSPQSGGSSESSATSVGSEPDIGAHGECAGLDRVLFQLRVIFISHMHADHHLGLRAVAIARERVRASLPSVEARAAMGDLIVVGPTSLWRWLTELDSCLELVPRMRFIDNASIQSESHAYEKLLLSRLHVSRFQTVRVYHCRDAYALVFETRGFRAADSLFRSDSLGLTQNNAATGSASSIIGDADGPGFKLSFSGDCRPSDNFIEVGMNSTVLIHEATFEDAMIAEAIAKRHSTIGEAIQVGTKMNAERILLTHFSQRYPKIPTLHEDGAPTGAGTRERRVCIAFDCMSVAFHQLRWLPLLLPSFKWLFPPEPANAAFCAE